MQYRLNVFFYDEADERILDFDSRFVLNGQNEEAAIRSAGEMARRCVEETLAKDAGLRIDIASAMLWSRELSFHHFWIFRRGVEGVDCLLGES